MKSILLTASDEGLIAGIIVGFIFFSVFTIAPIRLLIGVMRSSKPQKKTKLKEKLWLAIPFCLLFAPVGVYVMFLEYNLLKNYQYVEGTTLDYCRSGKSGLGIKFEYYINGRRYTSCNSHDPIEEIKVPDGKFKVRVSEFAPDAGRMDFEQPITDNSLIKQ